MEKRRGRPRKKSNPQSVENGNVFQSNSHIENIIDETNFDFVPDNSFRTPEINGFNPLGDAPIQRAYSSPNVDQGVMQDLAEPTFHKATFTQAEQEKENIIKSASQDSDKKVATPQGENQISNPALNELDDQEKKIACQQLVDACLDTYETLWSLAGGLVKVSDKKIKQLVKEGKLDPQQKIPIDERGTEVTTIEFIQSFNAQVPEAVEADPSFRKKVYAPLTRIFQKRGWGMTDEQTVLFAVLKDSATKGMSAWALKKSINEVLERLEEQTAMMREAKEQEQVYEAEEVTNADLEYERRMAEIRRQQAKKPTRNNKRKAKPSKSNAFTDKMDINFDDNPLRATIPDDYPEPKVEEYYTKGEEI